MSNEETSDPRYELARAAYGELTQRTFSDPKSATQALTRLAEFFPVFAPGGTTNVAEIAPGHSLLISSYVPQMCDEKGNGGDVYRELSSGTLCFRAGFLKRLAAGIGLEWLPEQKRIEWPMRGLPQGGWCVTVTVVGRYRTYAGEWRTVDASKTLDLRDEAIVGTKLATQEKQLRRERTDIQSRAETMAKSRCIADAAVKRTIEAEDVGRPVICASIYRTPSTDDVRAATSALYGETGAVIDHVEDTPQGNTGRPSSEAPVASPTREGGASSVETGPSPAAASPAGLSKSKPGCVHLPGHPEDGRTFAAASDDALRAYLDALANRIAAGRPGKMLDAMQAKYDEAEAVLLARRETTEGAPF